MIEHGDVILEEFRDWHEAGILGLYESVFNESMEASWTYYYKGSVSSPLKHDRHVIVVARDRQAIVGVVCIAAITVSYDGSLVKGGLVKDVMVHPEYRGRGIFTEASRLSYEIAKGKEIDFLMSFPNARSYPMFDKYLGWHTLTTVDVLEYPIVAPARKADYEVVCAAGAESLPRIVPVSARIQTYRDEVFYRRRYCEHWNSHKYFFVITKEGMLVLKRFNDETAHIMDLFTYDGEIGSLVDAAADYLATRGALRLTTFCAGFRERLLSWGFRENKGSTHFVVKPLDDRCAGGYKDLARYYVSWSDSDVY